MASVRVCVRCILEESATVVCHCVWVLCIGQLIHVFNGQSKHFITMTSANAVIH